MTNQDEWEKYVGYLNTLSLDEAKQFIARARAKQAAWKFLLNLQPGQKCLVLERGAGSVSIELAKNYQEMVRVVDDSEPLMALTGGTSNMTVVCFSFFSAFPFSESTFDGVVLHDMGGLCVGQRSTSVALLQLLSEAKRVLKSDGTLVVTGDNNSFFTRIRSELKRLKDWRISKERSSFPLRVFGFNQIDTIIQSLDFQHRDLFSITPRLIPFQEMTRVGAGRIYPIPSGAVSLQKWVSPAFAIITARRSAPDSFLNQFSKIVLNHLGGEEMISQKYISGNPDSVILICKARRGGIERSAVVRLPLTETSVARCHRGFSALQTLSERRTVLSGLVPSVLGHGEFCGQPYFVESLIDGKVIASPKPAALGRIVREATSLLTPFHQETAQIHLIDSTEFHRIASPFISGILPHIKRSDAQKSFSYIMDAIRERWLGGALPLVFSHGDFQADNMIINPDTLRIQGVIDWDLASDVGLPLLDLLYLFLYAETMLGRGNFEDIFLRQFFPLNLNNDTMTAIDQYHMALGIASDQTLPLLIFFWLHHVVFRLERFWLTLDRWMDQSFYPILFRVYEVVRQEKAA